MWKILSQRLLFSARLLSASDHWPQQQQQKQQKQKNQPSKGDGLKSSGASGANATEAADTPEEKAARAGLLKRTQVSFTSTSFQ